MNHLAQGRPAPPVAEALTPQTPIGPPQDTGPADRLPATSLVALARLFGIIWPLDGDVQDALPPDSDGSVTVDRFSDLAREAGLTLRQADIRVADLRSHHLPALVHLHDGSTFVVTRRSRTGRVLIGIGSAGGGGLTGVPIRDIAREQAGAVLLAGRRTLAQGERSAGTDQRRWFWGTITAYTPHFALAIACSILVNLFGIVFPLATMAVYDRIIPNAAMSSLIAAISGLLLMLGFEFGLKMLRSRLLDEIGQRVEQRVHGRILGHVLALRLVDKPASAGGFAGEITELEAVCQTVVTMIGSTLIDALFALVVLFVIYLVAGPIVAVPILAMVTIAIIAVVMHGPTYAATAEARASGSTKQGLLVETIAALETIKTLGAERARERVVRAAVGDRATTSRRTRDLARTQANLNAAIGQVVYIAVLATGTIAIFFSTLTVGALFAVTMLVTRVVGPVATLIGSASRLAQERSVLQSFDRVMALPVPTQSGGIPVQRITAGAVELRDVGFAYPSSRSPVLRDVNLRVGTGERIGIIGRSGSGKSTIAKIIAGLYEPAQGVILVGGLDGRQIPDTVRRRAIAYMQQDIDLFQGSLYENLILGLDDVGRDDVLAATRITGVEEMSRLHPQGLGMPISDRGRNLSIGQRQSVALARALLAKPRILILDEPTSGMDNALEARVVDQLRRAVTPDQTLIIISHRSTLLDLVTRLVLVDGGQIIADGPKEQVLQRLKEGGGEAARATAGADGGETRP